MKILKNPFRRVGMSNPALTDFPAPSLDWQRPVDLLKRCPRAGVTPLTQSETLAKHCDVAEVILKDERSRMGLGSFKALGAAYVIACDHAAGIARGATYITASAGNHGMSVAAGAAAFGAYSVVYIAETVPQSFADRLAQVGAQVVREGADYEASMQAAARAAKAQRAILLSDSSWPGYVERPHRLMEGYLALMAEVFEQMVQTPTHVFLQAGVGGLAGSAAAMVRDHWGDGPRVVVVEPEAAPALFASIEAGAPVATSGPSSQMGRLDCKEPSYIALKGLARDGDFFVTLSEEEGLEGARLAEESGLASTPSGAAGLAGLLASSRHRSTLSLDENARVLLILSESPET
ncbi:Diaminopropionate ammonia-lyase [Roseobacter fucihabitans]|uniref:Diaminopropionate ammonia-lyase n=1 Tax=Roseobacter fucihabitans TaxID=1537242 RepID=A0ABZ2BTL0_9RHOB|nr:pyridoxal-phosphate dependent enzyme [Roseobacter litoralis]MBC6966642.1 Diaminopropionate ammonia-lyase [Roseobacter litoralis]